VATLTAARDPFEPDSAVAPGETLLENIESPSMSQAELAVRAGLSAKTVNQIVQGKAPITPETAIRLERGDVEGSLAQPIGGVPEVEDLSREARSDRRVAETG